MASRKHDNDASTLLIHSAINQIKQFCENEKGERLDYGKILLKGKECWKQAIAIANSQKTAEENPQYDLANFEG